MAIPKEAAYLVRGTKEGATKVHRVAEKDNLLFVVGCKEETIGLVERGHFLVGQGFEIHRAGETGVAAVSERKCAFQELWRGMVAFLFV